MTRHVTSGLVFFCAVFAFATPSLLFADGAGFVSLVGIPGLNNPDLLGFQEYINMLLRIAIIAGALIAVVKLILAGAKYTLSGVVTDKSSAKQDIRSAIIGLLIILLAVGILTTINPQLTTLNALDNAPSFADTNVPNQERSPSDCKEDERFVSCGTLKTCTLKSAPSPCTVDPTSYSPTERPRSFMCADIAYEEGSTDTDCSVAEDACTQRLGQPLKVREQLVLCSYPSERCEEVPLSCDPDSEVYEKPNNAQCGFCKIYEGELPGGA